MIFMQCRSEHWAVIQRKQLILQHIMDKINLFSESSILVFIYLNGTKIHFYAAQKIC